MFNSCYVVALWASTHLCLHSFFFCGALSAKDEKGQEEADGGSR